MLIYLSNQQQIINTDFIVRVEEIQEATNSVDDLLNLKPEDKFDTPISTQTCCLIHMNDKTTIKVDVGIKELWETLLVK